MSFPLTPWQRMLSAARRGLSANQALAELRAAGEGIKRSTALELYKYAVAASERNKSEAGQNLESRPGGNRVTPWPTRNRTGYGQMVSLIYRERGTGQLKEVFHTTHTNRLITRKQAVQNAISAYEENADEYEQELVGATYRGTYRYTPLT